MSGKHMVDTQVRPRGVSDPMVLSAGENVKRELFVPSDYQRFAYSDCPLPLSLGQTISQPYMVAAMTELLRLTPQSKVLEIGTGSGYQTAILAEIAAEVYTVEILEALGTTARERLEQQGYTNIYYRIGDGYHGWPECGPYDGIIVTAAPTQLPDPLALQLKQGGHMVIPLGPQHGIQGLYVYQKQDDQLVEKHVMDVRFVPLTGQH